jgi:hypothetical protein
MVGKKASSRFDASHVVPQIVGDDVVCECGARMVPWNFISIPSQRRSILWRCEANPDHVSSMVPEYRQR